MFKGPLKVCLCGLAVVAALGCAESPAGEAAPSAQRRTPMVELYQLCAPSAVNLRGLVHNPKGYYDVSVGSGTLVHESGYILTANHVAKGPPSEAYLHDGRMYRYRTLMRIADDVALVKIDPPRRLKAMKIGRSHNLMPGESILIIGNPSGLMHTASPGIISGLNRSGEGIIVPGVFQVNAAVNGGNSGGPVINAKAEFIGMIQARMEDKINISFAVPVDHIRSICRYRMPIKHRLGVWLGLTVDHLGPARITRVDPGSPADKAGLRAGDLLRQFGSMRITDGLHFYVGLVERKVGETLPIEVERDGKIVKTSLTLVKTPLRPAEDVTGLVNGVRYSAYAGQWLWLPDFDKLKPVESGKADKLSHTVYAKAKDNFGLRFTGYIEVPADGAYTFYVASDDGSRLLIGDDVIISHDGLHPAFEENGRAFLKAGKHPITVTYFESGHDEMLRVSYEGPGLKKQEVPASALFVKP